MPDVWQRMGNPACWRATQGMPKIGESAEAKGGETAHRDAAIFAASRQASFFGVVFSAEFVREGEQKAGYDKGHVDANFPCQLVVGVFFDMHEGLQ